MVTGRHAARLPGHWTQRVGRGSVSGIVEGGCLRSDARAAAPQTVCAPSEGIHPIGSVHPVWGHSTREARFNLIGSIALDQNGLNDHRWGVSPHRQQASSWSWSPVPLPRFCRRRLSGVYRRPPYTRLRSRPSRRVVSKGGQALPPPINVARNSPAISSNVESTPLELQRFRAISKSDRREITCEICLEVVGAPPAGAVARLVSRSAPAASDPPPSAPGCMLG